MTNFTVLAVAKQNANNIETICAKNWGISGTGNAGFRLNFSAYGYAQINVATLNDGSLITVNAPAITTSNYNLVGGVFNGKLRAISGNEISSPSADFVFKPDTTHNLILGNRADGTNYLNGSIAMFIIYNRALSDTEYMQAYNYLRRLMNSRGITI